MYINDSKYFIIFKYSMVNCCHVVILCKIYKALQGSPIYLDIIGIVPQIHSCRFTQNLD
jgi:hypothetical protein